jgi:hypothetical protein
MRYLHPYPLCNAECGVRIADNNHAPPNPVPDEDYGMRSYLRPSCVHPSGKIRVKWQNLYIQVLTGVYIEAIMVFSIVDKN